MSPDQVAALGALFTGLGSLVGGVGALWLQRRRGKDECERRIEEIHKSFREGLELSQEMQEERWSHLP